MNWVLRFDGACEPVNPGGVCAYGWELWAPEGGLIGCGGGVLELPDRLRTNNVAEFAALEKGLEYAAKKITGGSPLLIYGDSMLVVKAVSGDWSLRKLHLAEIRDRILELLSELPVSWQISWTPREDNEGPDSLCKQALKESGALPTVWRRQKKTFDRKRCRKVI